MKTPNFAPYGQWTYSMWRPHNLARTDSLSKTTSEAAKLTFQQEIVGNVGVLE